MDYDTRTDKTTKCGICKDYFNDPVTLPCGHNFCKKCISDQWDREIYADVYCCPNCPETYAIRPDLTTNKTLLVTENKLQKMSLQDPAQDGMIAELKKRIQKTSPYLSGKARAKEKLQEMLCSQHERLLNVYCRDEEKFVCEECTLSTHSGHDTVSLEKERTDREQKVEELLQKSRAEMQERELNLNKILNAFEYIKGSSKCAVKANERAFTELIASLEKMKDGLKRTIQEQEKVLVNQAQLEERRQRLALQSLQAVIADLETLPQVKEDIHFITKCQSAIRVQETGPVAINISKNLSFEFAVIATNKVKEMLEDGCKDAIEKIQKTVRNVQLVKTSEEIQTRPCPLKPVRRSVTNVSGNRPPIRVPQPCTPFKLKTRQDFLNYACPLTLDPDTAHPSLNISDDNTRVSIRAKRSKNKSPKSFDRWEQVLCKEPLRGGCFYWEVEWSGKGAFIGIVQEAIARKGEGVDCGLGRNINSWCLQCSNINHSVWHNDVGNTITGNIFSPRIGIYLDHNAGSLAFFAVSDKMTCIHTFTTDGFSGPLFPAFGFGLDQNLQSWIKLHKFENS